MIDRPYIICHMLTSIDGKVTGNFLLDEKTKQSTEIYYQINRELKCDAFACGRVTMKDSFTGDYYPTLKEFKGIKVEKQDFIGDDNASFFAISFDRFGKLGWKQSKIIDEDEGYNNAHIIQVLTEQVNDDYLLYLRKIGVSYIFAGKKDIDLNIALQKLKRLFNINKILLEGGSIINGSFMTNNLIDEISVVISPITGEKDDKPLFYQSIIKTFKLVDFKRFEDVIWLDYKKI